MMEKKMINITCVCCGGSFKVPAEYLVGNAPAEGDKQSLGFGSNGATTLADTKTKEDKPLQMMFDWKLSTPAGDMCPGCCLVGMIRILAIELKNSNSINRLMQTGEGFGIGGSVYYTDEKDGPNAEHM